MLTQLEFMKYMIVIRAHSCWTKWTRTQWASNEIFTAFNRCERLRSHFWCYVFVVDGSCLVGELRFVWGLIAPSLALLNITYEMGGRQSLFGSLGEVIIGVVMMGNGEEPHIYCQPAGPVSTVFHIYKSSETRLWLHINCLAIK